MMEQGQWVHCNFLDNTIKDTIAITTVYGKHNGKERRELWDGLIKITPQTKWIVGGDFNVISDCSEHCGKHPPLQSDMEEFRDCLETCGLSTPHTIGSLFTWSGVKSNGRVMRRLDRALVNDRMIEDYEDITISHLSRASSDHKPILLQCKKGSQAGPKPFRFLNAWLNHHSFLKMVSDHWDSSSHHGSMAGLAFKLHGLKRHIKEWNIKTFGNVVNKLKEAVETAIKAQEQFEKDPTPENRELDNKAKA
ncbi:unnamed protein product [Cuscuta campestris]|uniref:Endonuclease/exonuclease/phosphatase domain-containing protein n=1 Tax=Cuscuta campestris TaxID=132261 RepID=A0A484MIW7_9ASTE|nr:unnamed protein product [Cuscuta campestris]